MIELRELPSTIARLIPREFLQWLLDDRTRTNYKIDIMPDAEPGNIPYIDTGGELTDSGRTGPAGDFVGTTDTQTLINKRLEMADLNQPAIDTFSDATHNHENAAGGGQIDEDALALTDVTTNNASTTKHGFLKKLSNVATEFLNGQGSFAAPDHGSLGGLADDDHTQYLNTTRHDTTDRHADAVIFTAAMTDYSSTSTVTGWGSTTVKEIWYKKLGKLVFVWFRIEGATDSTAATFTLPYTSKATAPGYSGLCLGKDNTTYNACPYWLPNNSNLFTVYNGLTFADWTAAGSVDKDIGGQFFYEAAS